MIIHHKPVNTPTSSQQKNDTDLDERNILSKGEYWGGWTERKTHLSYVSAMHEMHEAKAAGYDEDEIVKEVTRAIIPSFTLWNILETIADLSLDR